MISFGVTLGLLLAWAALSDTGGLMGFWNSPRILLMRSFSA
jgi:hypothetical protein